MIIKYYLSYPTLLVKLKKYIKGGKKAEGKKRLYVSPTIFAQVLRLLQYKEYNRIRHSNPGIRIQKRLNLEALRYVKFFILSEKKCRWWRHKTISKVNVHLIRTYKIYSNFSHFSIRTSHFYENPILAAPFIPNADSLRENFAEIACGEHSSNLYLLPS